MSLCLQHGGAEQWVQSLVRFCDPATIDWVGVVVPNRSDAHGLMHSILSAQTTVGVGPDAVDALYRACDVILVWGVPADNQRIPPRPRDCKVVIVSHGVCEFTSRAFARAEDADAVAAVARCATAPMGRFAAAATVIPNCYDPARLTVSPGAREHLRAEWGVRSGEHVVGFLGRCSSEKNPEALVWMVAASSHVRGIHCGIGDTSALAAMASQLGCADRLVLNGPVPQPGDVLAAFDHLLFPSHQDACGIAILEAWATGLPVIATPVGIAAEHPDLVRPVPLNPTGDQIAKALADDLADEVAVRARVARAAAVAKADYSPERFGRDWTEFIISLQPTLSSQNGHFASRAPSWLS